jgi:hypothetical protein
MYTCVLCDFKHIHLPIWFAVNDVWLTWLHTYNLIWSYYNVTTFCDDRTWLAVTRYNNYVYSVLLQRKSYEYIIFETKTLYICKCFKSFFFIIISWVLYYTRRSEVGYNHTTWHDIKAKKVINIIVSIIVGHDGRYYSDSRGPKKKCKKQNIYLLLTVENYTLHSVWFKCFKRVT